MSDQTNLVTPVDASTVDGNSLVTPDQVQEKKKSEGASEDALSAARAYGATLATTGVSSDSYIPEGMTQNVWGTTISNVDYDAYDKYIDRPFSFVSDDVNELRAQNQSTAEKWAHGSVKLLGKTGTNVLGSTVGLGYGAVSWATNLFTEESATRSFFDNDFQRGLDGINEWMDGKLPNYYTKEEQEYNVFQKMGTANFWANDFTQGLSFIAGAVLAETLTAGAATSGLAAKATKILQGATKGRSGTYLKSGTTNATAGNKIDKMFDGKQIKNALTSVRQLGTGAMYESGVEARHHFDSVVGNLVKDYKDKNNGAAPSMEKMAEFRDLATKSSNSVFAGNLALVGYGNYMMFPKIFGKGYNSTKGSLVNTIKSTTKDRVRKYEELYKALSKKESIARTGWKVLKTPLYEGFVEEGGQKLLDLAGQGAAYDFYLSKRDEGFVNTTVEMLYNMDDVFGEVYGSNEGQTEIGIGFLLAAMGLPSYSRVNSKDGKSKQFGWSGGVSGSLKDETARKEEIAGLKKLLERGDMLQSYGRNLDTYVRNGVIQDTKDQALLINSPFIYKNAEHDEIFNYINSRLRAGFDSEIQEDIDNIRGISLEEFRNNFMYNEANDLTDAELKDRRESLAKGLEERVQTIKETSAKVDRAFINFGEDQRTAVVQALSVSKDSDAREDAIIRQLTDMGLITDIEVEEDKSKADERASNEAKLRLRNLWDRISFKDKVKIAESNPDAVEKVKRNLNIKELTDPTHMEELYRVILLDIAEVTGEITEVEQNKDLGKKEKEEKLRILGEKKESLVDRQIDLTKAINKGLDPYISAQEQQMLDAWEKAEPTKAKENMPEAIQLLKDARKLRARRHRALSMYNELLELREEGDWNPKGWWKVWGMEKGQVVPQPEMLLQQMLDTNLGESSTTGDKNLDRLYQTYKGKVVEMEYTNSQGNTSTKRYYVTNSKISSAEDKVLQQLPTLATLSILKKESDLKDKLDLELEELEADDFMSVELKNAQAIKVDILSKELEGIQEILKGPEHVSEPTAVNVGMLTQALNGLTVIDEAQIAKEMLEASISEVNTELTDTLTRMQKELEEFSQEIVKGKAIIADIRNGSSITKDGDAAKVVMSWKQDIRNYKKGIERLEKSIKAIETNLALLKDFTNKDQSPKSVQDALDMVEGLFKESFTSVHYASIYNKLLKNPAVSLIQDSEKKINVDKLIEISKALSEGGAKAEELLLEFRPTIKDLFLRIAKTEKALDELSAIISIKKDGTPYANTPQEQKDKFNNYTRLLDNYAKEVSTAYEDLHNAVEELRVSTNQMTSVAAKVADHLVFLNTTLAEFMVPSSEDDGSEYMSSTDGNMTVKDLSGATDPQSILSFFSSSIGSHDLAKTAGAHKYAKDRLEKLENDMYHGTQKEKDAVNHSEVEALRDQVLFFAYTSANNFSKNSTKDGHRMMVVNRENLPYELQDKLFFHDGTRTTTSKWFRGKRLGQDEKSTLNKEDKESLLMVLTDETGKPILFPNQDGKIRAIYTAMPTTETSRTITTKGGDEVTVYRYGQSDLKPGYSSVIDSNDKEHFIGEVKSSVLEAIDSHRERRQEYLDQTDTMFVPIVGQSSPMVMRHDDDLKSPPSKSISTGTHNILLQANTGKSNSVTIGSGSMRLNNGMSFIEKDGKLIPVYANKLTDHSKETLYQLFVRYAENQQAQKEGKLLEEQAFRIFPEDENSQTITQAIKNFVFFGPNTNKKGKAEGSAPRFEIKHTRDSFVVYYGKHGEIELSELLDPSASSSRTTSFKLFISNLGYNINYYMLGLDDTARQGGAAYEDWKTKKKKEEKSLRNRKGKPLSEDAINKAMSNWLKENTSPAKAATVYDPYTEYRINSEGDITSHVWINYTDYLLGDGKGDFKRDASSEIPLYTYMIDKIHPPGKDKYGQLHGGKNFLHGAQFLNTYLRVDHSKKVFKAGLKKKAASNTPTTSGGAASSSTTGLSALKAKQTPAADPIYNGVPLTLKYSPGAKVDTVGIILYYENGIFTEIDVETAVDKEGDSIYTEDSRVKFIEHFNGIFEDMTEAEIFDYVEKDDKFISLTSSTSVTPAKVVPSSVPSGGSLSSLKGTGTPASTPTISTRGAVSSTKVPKNCK